MELDFNLTSFIIIIIPVVLFIWAIKKKKLILKASVLFIVHMLWLVFWYFELSCQSKSCLEWETSSPGSVLTLFSLFPFAITILSIPWYFSLVKNLNLTSASKGDPLT